MTKDDEELGYPSFLEGAEMDEREIKEVEEKFNSLLRVITEDARQLSEYLVEEGSMVNDICVSLRKIFSELDLSVVLPKKAVPSIQKSKEIILNSQGHLIIVQKDGTVESKSLEKYPPDMILMVVWGLIPRLREEVSSYMRKVRMRLNFLEMVNQELKNIQKPFQTYEERIPRNPVEEFQEKKVREVFLPPK